MKSKDGSGEYREIIITGFGGQGIILAGNILGKCAALFEKKNATLIQSYGPEARGGACAVQVVVSSDTIEYPYVETPHILVCMSQEGFDRNIPKLVEKGTLFLDSGLVEADPGKVPAGAETYSISATVLAEEMGARMMANIIMLGFVVAVTGLVSYESLREAIRTSVPKGTEERNISGMDRGFQHGVDEKAKRI